jgi:sn-1 stearoyl-lipid 9-desaturase
MSVVSKFENLFSSPASREGKAFSPITFGLILFVHVMAFVFAPMTFSLTNLWLFVVFYVITGLGVTFGLHRFFTHRSFEIQSRFVLFLTFLASTLAMQGDVIEWVVDHFKHHLNSDQENDTHSPHQDRNKLRGFLWSHFVWLFYSYPLSDQQKRLKANLLNKGWMYRFFGNKANFLVTNVASAFLIYWGFGFGGLIWGFFVRTVFVWHITWLVNSASHLWGFRDYQTTDASKNNWWVALLTFGEGWHNNHHHKQDSPRHGLKWWQFDPTFYLIWTLSKLKLVSYN